MTTAIEVAERSLKLILVQAADAPLEPDEYQDFYDAMNDYMADLEARGVVLGYTPVTGPDDTVTVPDGAIRGLVYNLAMEVAPDYGAAPSALVVNSARESYRTLRRLGKQHIATSFPARLPIGSGSQDVIAGYRPLYDAYAAVSLSLKGNTEVTSIAVVDTPVKVSGFWINGKSQGLKSDITGRVTNSSRMAMTVDSTITLKVSGGSNVTAHLYVSGVSVATSSGVANGSDITLKASTDLNPNDYLELWIENDTDTTNLTVTDCDWTVT